MEIPPTAPRVRRHTFDAGRACGYCGGPLTPRPGESPARFSRRRFHDRACSARAREAGARPAAEPPDDPAAVEGRYREVHEAKLAEMRWQWRRFKRRVYKAPRFGARGA
jgi:hypothetical protein